MDFLLPYLTSLGRLSRFQLLRAVPLELSFESCAFESSAFLWPITSNENDIVIRRAVDRCVCVVSNINIEIGEILFR